MSTQIKTFRLMPASPGRCPICADKEHGPEIPHNRDSLFYQVSFKEKHGRSPTWADAASECSELVIRTWRNVLYNCGVKPEKIGRMLGPAEAEAADGVIALIKSQGPQGIRAINSQFEIAKGVLKMLVCLGELEFNGKVWSIPDPE